MTENDKRLIEDYLPIVAISAEASREKGVRKGHISTLHLWWARRPLVACRAAVYGALVPSSRFMPDGATDAKKRSLGRANAATFVQRLCRYPSGATPETTTDIDRALKEAQRHIFEAHAERLTAETRKSVSAEDIAAGRAPRPKVLDMFAGGGAIPLEALRLGCDAFALDLNPVAHIIELCTLVYPQKHGAPDSATPGMTGPKDARGQVTWGGLAKEVRYWGDWVLHRVKAEVGDLYPPIPDPEFHGTRIPLQGNWLKEDAPDAIPAGYLVPGAYLWARTVRCKNPACHKDVPLFGQLWLRRKAGRSVHLILNVDSEHGRVSFSVAVSASTSDKGATCGHEMDASSTSCPFCQAAQDGDYIRSYGATHGYGQKLMAIACTRKGTPGKIYLASSTLIDDLDKTESLAQERLMEMSRLIDSSPLDATILPTGNAGYSTGKSYLHGVTTFRQAYSPRQLATLLTFARTIASAQEEIARKRTHPDAARALGAYLCLLLSQSVNRYCSLTRWNNVAESVADFSSMKRFALSWDWPEVNPWSDGSGNFSDYLNRMCAVLTELPHTQPATVTRGSATEGVPDWPLFDAVVTDPPYYDNESYAELSDMFYVWFRITAGGLFPEHLATVNTPKKKEVIAAAYRQGGSREAAHAAYLNGFLEALKTAHRHLASHGVLALVYAHKTTAGWGSMISAVKNAGFQITEAWPLDTEKKGRAAHQDDAALASSIFLIARKRDGTMTASYHNDVRPELEQIVRERVGTLWEMGISGADLVIACVGAGLRAFTRFFRVEYANGEEVPPERFLTEVETVVLETVLARLSTEVGGNAGEYSLAGLDASTRFYVLWRYTYQAADLDAGEAIIFANGTHVELDGAHGLSGGARALVAKNKSKYHLQDYSERGDDDKLGLPTDDGRSPALIDALHRILWLMEKRPGRLPEFLKTAQPNREQLRLVAQALAGPALKGSELGDVSPTGELAALAKLTANWRGVVEDTTTTPREKEDKRTGQRNLDFGGGKR